MVAVAAETEPVVAAAVDTEAHSLVDCAFPMTADPPQLALASHSRSSHMVRDTRDAVVVAGMSTSRDTMSEELTLGVHEVEIV